MRFLIPILLLLGACAPNKSWQEACFQRVGTERTGLFGANAAPAYDPVLTVRQHQGRTLVYCDS